jgi:hypothetical protein
MVISVLGNALRSDTDALSWVVSGNLRRIGFHASAPFSLHFGLISPSRCWFRHVAASFRQNRIPAPHQRIGNQVSVPPFMSGTSRVLPSGMSEMSAADWNLSDRSLGGSLAEISS